MFSLFFFFYQRFSITNKFLNIKSIFYPEKCHFCLSDSTFYLFAIPSILCHFVSKVEGFHFIYRTVFIFITCLLYWCLHKYQNLCFICIYFYVLIIFNSVRVFSNTSSVFCKCLYQPHTQASSFNLFGLYFNSSYQSSYFSLGAGKSVNVSYQVASKVCDDWQWSCHLHDSYQAPVMFASRQENIVVFRRDKIWMGSEFGGI